MNPFATNIAFRRSAMALLATGTLVAGTAQLNTSSVHNHKAVGEPHTIEVEYSSVTDFADDRRLAGFAEDVFFGEVLDQGRTTVRQPIPETDHRVRVLDVVKGDARGEILVTQEGGFDPSRNEHKVMHGDTPLQAGRVYLFATRSDPRGRHFLVPGHGDVAVKDAAHRAELRRRFSEASRNQIALTPEG
jgi:hypothetical protein